MVSLATVLAHHPNVRYRLLGQEAVVLNQKAAEVLVLDEVGARMFALADGVSPLGRWVEVLGSEYDVAGDVLTQDTLDFAAQLLGEGLLVEVSGSASP